MHQTRSIGMDVVYGHRPSGGVLQGACLTENLAIRFVSDAAHTGCRLHDRHHVKVAACEIALGPREKLSRSDESYNQNRSG